MLVEEPIAIFRDLFFLTSGEAATLSTLQSLSPQEVVNISESHYASGGSICFLNTPCITKQVI